MPVTNPFDPPSSPELPPAEPTMQELIEERDLLRRRVHELQVDSSKALEGSLYRTVRYFHEKFGHPIAHTPCVPSDDQVRFRLKLITEEFRELLGAATGCATHVEEAFDAINKWIEHGPVVVDLPEFVDAMADLDYVIEGTRAVFGVYGKTIAEAVHAANMAKDAVYVQEKDGFKMGTRIKPKKPEGWTPPDVAGLLRAQGWDGFDGRRESSRR